MPDSTPISLAAALNNAREFADYWRSMRTTFVVSDDFRSYYDQLSESIDIVCDNLQGAEALAFEAASTICANRARSLERSSKAASFEANKCAHAIQRDGPRELVQIREGRAATATTPASATESDR